MTQILLYKIKNGISLSTDSRAVAYTDEGQPNYFEVHKIFPLSPHVVLITGGAGYGIAMSRKFQDHVKTSNLWSYDDIIGCALPFLQDHMIKRVESDNEFFRSRADLQRVYFLIAGYRTDLPRDPFGFRLLGSEQSGDPLHDIQTGEVVAIPRQLGIEYQLSRLAAQNSSLDEADALCEKFLRRRAKASDEVAAPFYFVRITADGIKVRALK